EQRLAGEGQELADALDVGDEAHVEHAVGFIDDQHLDAGEQELAAFEVIEEATRRGDDDIGAAVDLGGLVVEGDAADQEGYREPVMLPEALEGLLDLCGELAGRLEYERARDAGAGPSGLEQRQHG